MRSDPPDGIERDWRNIRGILWRMDAGTARLLGDQLRHGHLEWNDDATRLHELADEIDAEISEHTERI